MNHTMIKCQYFSEPSMTGLVLGWFIGDQQERSRRGQNLDLRYQKWNGANVASLSRQISTVPSQEKVYFSQFEKLIYKLGSFGHSQPYCNVPGEIEQLCTISSARWLKMQLNCRGVFSREMLFNDNGPACFLHTLPHFGAASSLKCSPRGSLAIDLLCSSCRCVMYRPCVIRRGFASEVRR